MNDLSVLRAAFIKNPITQNMEIEIPLSCPKCQGRLYSVSYETYLTSSKREAGRSARTATMKEIQMISKNQSAVHE